MRININRKFIDQVHCHFNYCWHVKRSLLQSVSSRYDKDDDQPEEVEANEGEGLKCFNDFQTPNFYYTGSATPPLSRQADARPE